LKKIISFFIALIGSALAQPQATFEVASVKPASAGAAPAGLFTYPGGRIIASQCTLDYLIMEAFNVEAFQVSGGPRWMHEDRYDIEAKPPASSKSSKANPLSFKSPPNEEQREMLQALLADRFQFRYHRENREGPVFLLLKSDKALRLQDARDKDAYSWAGINSGGGFNGEGIAGINISMAQLATRLSGYLRRPVLDQTGLAGSFDFKFEYDERLSDNARSDITSSILASLQGIGLRLESAKGPVETIVVDHAEKPSEN
jgi:uncharacterized protein (TIGR03435 family)